MPGIAVPKRVMELNNFGKGKRYRTLSSVTMLGSGKSGFRTSAGSDAKSDSKDDIAMWTSIYRNEAARSRTSSFVLQRNVSSAAYSHIDESSADKSLGAKLHRARLESFSRVLNSHSKANLIASATDAKDMQSSVSLFSDIKKKGFGLAGSSRVKRLLYLTFFVKLFIFALAVLSHVTQTSFDLSGDLYVDYYKSRSSIQQYEAEDGSNWRFAIESFVLDRLKPFVRWDALYFLAIMENGYTFEQEHAFFPLLPALSRLVNYGLLWLPTSWIFSSMTRNILAGLLLSNFCFIMSVLGLYWYDD